MYVPPTGSTPSIHGETPVGEPQVVAEDDVVSEISRGNIYGSTPTPGNITTHGVFPVFVEDYMRMAEEEKGPARNILDGLYMLASPVKIKQKVKEKQEIDQTDIDTKCACLIGFEFPKEIQSTKGVDFQLEMTVMMLKSFFIALANEKGIDVNDSGKMLNLIKSTLNEYETVFDLLDIVLYTPNSEKRGEAYKKLEKTLTQRGRDCLETEKTRAPFEKNFKFERNKNLPSEMSHELTVGDQKYTESLQAPSYSNHPGASFLTLKDMNNFATFINNNFSAEKSNFFKPSAAKKESESHGLTTNCWMHRLNAGETSHSIARSGAFTVHGDETVSEDQKLNLCVAQALPKIAMALKENIRNKNLKDGETLIYVEQSLLSSLNPSEKKMLDDTDKAIDYIRDHFEVIVTGTKGKDGQVEKKQGEGEKFILYVYKEGAEEQTHPLCPVLFVKGINEEQKIREFFGIGTKDDLQGSINAKSLGILNNAFGNTDLDGQFSNNKLTSIEALFEYLNSKGVALGIHCKSGKDRTALVITAVFSTLSNGGVELTRTLRRGLSLMLTRFNTNFKVAAYAINWFQRLFFDEKYQVEKGTHRGDVSS